MRILTNENKTMLKVLKEHIPQCKRIIIVAGYMTEEGLALLETSFGNCIKLGGEVQIFIGNLTGENDCTSCLRVIDQWKPRIGISVANNPKIFVHGKLYLLQKEYHSILILGSSNLTYQGLVENQEINVEMVLDEQELTKLMNYINSVAAIAVPIEEYYSNMRKEGSSMAKKNDTNESVKFNSKNWLEPKFIFTEAETSLDDSDSDELGDLDDIFGFSSAGSSLKSDKDIAEQLQKKWDENLIAADNFKLDFDTVERIGEIADEVFDYIDQDIVDDWYAHSASMSEEFNKILNEEELIHSGNWTGESFKVNFLKEKVWAIKENVHTDLWPRIRNFSGDKIVEHILDMLEAVENDEEADKVLETGRIYNVIGISIASEILHKCYSQVYALKNKRSEWGMAFILNQGDGCEFAVKMTYSEFIRYVDAVFEVFAVWLEEQGIIVDEDYRYFICDRFFWQISENQRYKMLMQEYSKGKKEKLWR